MAASSNRIGSKNSSGSAAPPPPPVTVVGGNLYPSNTAFIQTDPSNFKAVVQKLTGFRRETLTPHHEALLHSAGKSNSGEMGPRKQAFKLHERRLSAKKLEIMLMSRGGIGGEKVMASPVSPFELLLGQAGGGSSRSSTPTPGSTNSGSSSAMADEEMRGIIENGFYLYPSHLCSKKISKSPELLPLFPIHAGRDFSGVDGDADKY